MGSQLRYEFHVEERLSAMAVAAFPELVAAEANGGTCLSGVVRDDAELYGLLDRFFVMGITIVDMHRLEE